ncbi:MAG: TetR/AcrR family transcriptional regulator [Actinomycetaceae bacterium]|nr:TetR/AcrR family transcriptional regulator [Actinomycetaceae bacterium]
MARKTVSRGPAAKRGEVRERLLEIAHEAFSRSDFSAVTMRDLAAKADCDPGLINYYFGSKAGLFRESMSLPQDPVKVIHEAIGEGGLGTGERLVLAVLKLWEESKAATFFKAIASSILVSEATFSIYSNWMENAMIKPLAAKLNVPEADLRLELVLGEILGLFSARYIFARPPLVTMPREEVARRYGRVVDLTLYGKVPPASP